MIVNEILWRIVVFVIVFGAMAVWEWRRPRRMTMLGRWRRWPNNFGILLLDAMLVRLVSPAAAIGAALAAPGFGLMPLLGLSLWPAAVIGFVLLDLAIYAQHVVLHKVPWLWRVHRMHHTDLDLDVSTGVRFHPVEILLSLAIKMAVVVLVGIPAAAVFLFEVVLNAAAMFNHGNVSVPARLERWLRWVIVTPQMHEVHHSIVRRDTDSNYGFNFSLWDRLFQTYRSAPTSTVPGSPVTIGICEFRESGEARLDRMLTQPFRYSGNPLGSIKQPRDNNAKLPASAAVMERGPVGETSMADPDKGNPKQQSGQQTQNPSQRPGQQGGSQHSGQQQQQPGQKQSEHKSEPPKKGEGHRSS